MLKNVVFSGIVGLSILLGTVVAGSAHAVTIGRIVVDGNTALTDEAVQNMLPFAAGANLQPEQLSGVIESLYRTELFADVQAQLNGDTLQIRVKENPVVAGVFFEGNEELSEKVLKDLLSVQEGDVFNKVRVKQDIRALVKAYRERGRYLTTVEPQLIDVTDASLNAVHVVYKVTEGDETKIREIMFIGNKAFTDTELRREIYSRQDAFWRVFSRSTNFTQEQIALDKDLLRRFYLRNGYADFSIASAVAEMAADRSHFVLTMTVDEGAQYDVGAVTVNPTGEAGNLNTAMFRDDITLEGGETYDALEVENTINNLTETLGNNGFAFVNVQPDFQKRPGDKLDIIFNLEPGAKVYVNRIDIAGNKRTAEEVIRRELKLVEGDMFNAYLVNRSRERLQRLGFFERVTIDQAPTEDPSQVNLTVNVTEQSTGEFNIGAGFSTFEGGLLSADLRERNFLGNGQDVAVNFALSEIKQDLSFSFTEPYFLNRNLSAGVDFFMDETDFQDESSYDIERLGGAVRMGFPLGEYAYNNFKLGYKDIEITDVASTASQFVQRDEGKRNSVTLGHTLAYDTRDSRLEPTKGYRVALATEYAGLGGDTEYIKGQLSGSVHKELLENVVLTVGARTGVIENLGDDDHLPIYEHFSAGGANLRGFDTSGIGPRDATTLDALGGTFMVGNTVELSFPLGALTDAANIKGVIFSDGGLVKDFDEGNTAGAVLDSGDYRVTAGTGIHWRSPIGPLRLEFAWPLIESEEDEKRVFSFNVGSRF